VFKYFDKPFLFEEFDWWLSDKSWPLLKEMANYYQDKYILIAPLDHKRDLKKFYKRFGYVYWAKVPLTATKEDYLKLLVQSPKEGEGYDIMTLSSKVIIASSSLKWIVYAERGAEIGVLSGNHFNEVVKKLDNIKTMQAFHNVIESTSVTFYNKDQFLDFKQLLVKNYKVYA
jgi:hypothetical protein